MNVLKILFNPVFLLAAGLHAGLLLIPVAGGSSEEIVPAPDPEGESITVTRIPPKQTKSASDRTATPKANSKPKPSASQSSAKGKTTAGGQQRTQGNTRSSQRSGSTRNSNRSGNRNRANSSASNSRSSRTQRDSSNEIVVLPPTLNEEGTLGNGPTTEPSTPDVTQTAPTLVVLREGAQSQGVPQLLQDFLVRLQYSLRETRQPAVEEAKQTWLAALDEQLGLRGVPPEELEESLEISYPLTVDYHGPRLVRSCLNPLPKEGLIGVVVDENGAIATAPTLLRSSGYPFLNEVALTKIQDYESFPKENSQKIYTVPVAVNYDEAACVNLAKLGVVPTETPTPQETPPTPPEGSRNFLEEEADEPSPFGN